MNILIIISEYLPDQNPNVYRWSAIGEHWAAAGHDVHVLTAKRHDAPTSETINRVRVTRAGQSTLLDWTYNTLKVTARRQRPLADKNARPQRPSMARRMMEKLVSLTWRTFYWPDGSCIWYFPARRAAVRLIREAQIDMVVTVCYPFTALLIGRYLKALFPQIFWLADIEDPFSLVIEAPKNNHFLYQRLNVAQEKKAFLLADRVSVTNQVVADMYAEQIPIDKDRLVVIPPIWLPEEIEHTSLSLSKDAIHLAYIGAFYTAVREPTPLLNLFRKLLQQDPDLRLKIKVHLVGEIAPEFTPVFNQFGDLSDVLVFHGFKSRKWVALCMEQMDVLINIGNTTSFQLPSKVVDYYASGKPILNICQIRQDSFKGFFEDYPMIQNVHLEEIKDDTKRFSELATFIRQAKGKQLPTADLQNKLVQHGVEAIAAKYLSGQNHP